MFGSILLTITLIALVLLNIKLDKMMKDGSYAEK